MAEQEVASLFASLGLKPNTAEWAGGQKLIDGIGKAMQSMENAGKRANAALAPAMSRWQRIGQSFAAGFKGATEQVARAMTSTFAKIGGIGGVLGGFGAIKLADEYTNLENRLRQVSTSSADLNGLMNQTLSIANATRTEWGATGEAYSRLANAGKDLGLSQERLLGITKTLAQASSLGGATAQEASNALRQLMQGLGSGALRGDEFNSVAEQMPILLDLVAAHLKKPRAELRKLAEDGKITAKVMIGAIEGAANSIDERFGKAVPTAGQQVTVLKNNLTLAAGEFIRSTGIVNTLGEAFGRMSRWMVAHRADLTALGQRIGGVLRDLGSALGSAFEWVSEHGDLVIATLKGVGVAVAFVAAKAIWARVMAFGPLFAGLMLAGQIFTALKDKIGTVGAALAAAFSIVAIKALISHVATLTTGLKGAAVAAAAANAAGSGGGGGSSGGKAGKGGRLKGFVENAPIIGAAGYAIGENLFKGIDHFAGITERTNQYRAQEAAANRRFLETQVGWALRSSGQDPAEVAKIPVAYDQSGALRTTTVNNVGPTTININAANMTQDQARQAVEDALDSRMRQER